MAFRDLHDFVTALEKAGELVRVKAEVDPELEITEITDRVSKQGGPALLFERVKGSDIPVLINSMGSYRRMSMALGTESLDEIGEEIASFLDMAGNMPSSLLGKLKLVPQLGQVARFFPRLVKNGPCQEVVEDEVDLSRLPILKCWPQDGGKYITLPLVFTKNPETGKRNLGMYRMQVYDERTTGMHWHLHHDGAENFRLYAARGEDMPVAVAIGADPAIVYSATAPLPRDIDELILAGFLRKEPVELVKCRTVDLEVPAHAEIVLEGYVRPGELRREGPFGDHTGYYSLADDYPVFHVTCVTRKRNPIYMTTIVGRPPMEDCYMGKATERIFLYLLKLMAPEVVDMNMPLEGVFHGCVIVSIKKSYPGQPKKIMNLIWGLGQMMFTKFIIVVDEGIDPHDVSSVMWKVFNNVDPVRDLLIVEGPVDALDHASSLPHLGNKLGIDATKKGPSDGHYREWPDDITMKAEIKEMVTKRWIDYGIDLPSSQPLKQETSNS